MAGRFVRSSKYRKTIPPMSPNSHRILHTTYAAGDNLTALMLQQQAMSLGDQPGRFDGAAVLVPSNCPAEGAIGAML